MSKQFDFVMEYTQNIDAMKVEQLHELKLKSQNTKQMMSDHSDATEGLMEDEIYCMMCL